MKKMLLLLATLLLLLGSTTALADTYRFGTVANSSSVNLRSSSQGAENSRQIHENNPHPSHST